MENRPGGAMARRELHVIWLLDTSGSMNADGKIQALNVAIRETIPQLIAAARGNPNVDVLVRAVAFADGARWHVEQPTPVSSLRWNDVTAGGHTDLGAALALVAGALDTPPMPERAVSPVLVLVTDGFHTDDFDAGLAALMHSRWGRDAVRIAITIGRDVNMDALQAFIGDPDIRPLTAQNAEALVQHIRWASRTGVESASQIADVDVRRRSQEAQQASALARTDVADEW
ncbi:MAG: VWA domain-containing protein [Proteobacteria bacterium]|nr:VWA domain-containing protein [Pseudomonadota bacterium]